mmetsp:Transcript_20397/g.36278  ORF Transcript_20397/g.36278 Transcript_20397/m.36278 type:complete len:270 (+) Transcript_20397:1995-2804(+)
MGNCLQESVFDLAHQPFQGVFAEFVVPQHLLGSEGRPKVHFEEHRSVFLHFVADGVAGLGCGVEDADLGAQVLDSSYDLLGIEVALSKHVDFEPLLRVPDQTLEIHWEIDRVLAGSKEPEVAKALPVEVEAGVLVFESFVSCLALEDLLLGLRVQQLVELAFLPDVKVVVFLELLVGHFDGVDLLLFDARAVEPVLPVAELDDFAQRVAYRPVVLQRHVFHRLHQPPLNVTGFRRLTRSVDDTLPASHRVEEELLGGETLEVRVFDKST